jgi:hypothetical protein
VTGVDGQQSLAFESPQEPGGGHDDASDVAGIRKLPEANEFSPGQIDLTTILGIIGAHAGDRAGQIEAIRQAYFLNAAASHADPERRLRQQQTRAYNVLVGAKGYGLISFETMRLTPFAESLLAEPDPQRRNEKFAGHILRTRHGIDVLRAIQSLQRRGIAVSKRTLADELRGMGFETLPAATTHHTKLLQWLRTAGVVDGRYEIDADRVSAVSGVNLAAVEDWGALSRPQRAFLRTLRRLVDTHGPGALRVREVVTAAVFEQGPVFRDDQLRADILRPLEDQGWISTSGVGPGRGGKSGEVAATERLLETEFEAITGYAQGEIPSEIRAKLNTPLDEIHEGLASSDRGVKGIALELLAVRLASDLGLIPLRFRLRGVKTGGAEVDLLAEGAHLHFSRWLFQCKNQIEKVPLSDLAKEVGMATLLHGHVVVLATTGKFANSVVQYAEELASTSPLQVVLLDGQLLKRYRSSGSGEILDFFHKRAQQTMRLKRPQVLESIEGAEDE